MPERPQTLSIGGLHPGQPRSAGHHRWRCRRERENKVNPMSNEFMLRHARRGAGITEAHGDGGREGAGNNQSGCAAIAEAVAGHVAMLGRRRCLGVGGLVCGTMTHVVMGVGVDRRRSRFSLRRPVRTARVVCTHRTRNQTRARGDRRAPQSPHQEPDPPVASGPSHPLSVRRRGGHVNRTPGWGAGHTRSQTTATTAGPEDLGTGDLRTEATPMDLGRRDLGVETWGNHSGVWTDGPRDHRTDGPTDAGPQDRALGPRTKDLGPRTEEDPRERVARN